MLSLVWWKEYKVISSSTRAGQDDFWNFYLWKGGLFSELKLCIFWPSTYTPRRWWRNIKLSQAVFVSVNSVSMWNKPRFYVKYTRFLCETNSVSMWNKHRFYVKQTPFPCETNPVSMWNNSVSMRTVLYLWGRICIFGDSSLFLIRQNRFCVNGSVSAFTWGNI